MTNRYSYDAWGRPRDPDTWALLPISITDALANLNAMQPRFDRGYTGHEHMCGFGLINMNGRLYDPYLQRFLSPDNYVQSPFNAQSYNRYGYCMNNPLMYTDPSGYTWFTKLGHWLGNDAKGLVTTLTSIGVVIGVAAICAATGGLATPIIGPIAGASGGLASGVLGTAFAGGSFKDYLTNGLTGAAIGGVCGMMGASMITSGLSTTFSSAFTSFFGSTMSSVFNGQGDPSISFGFGSINLVNGNIRSIFSNRKSSSEWLMYGLGGLGNIGDAYGIYANYRASKHSAQKGTPIDAPAIEYYADGKPVASHALGTVDGTNFYGPSKTGWDPEQIYNSGFKPTNCMDELAYVHDIVHYNTGTDGLLGSLLSTNNAAIASDIALSRGLSFALQNNCISSAALIGTARWGVFGMASLGFLHMAEQYSSYLHVINKLP